MGNEVFQLTEVSMGIDHIVTHTARTWLWRETGEISLKFQETVIITTPM